MLCLSLYEFVVERTTNYSNKGDAFSMSNGLYIVYSCDIVCLQLHETQSNRVALKTNGTSKSSVILVLYPRHCNTIGRITLYKIGTSHSCRTALRNDIQIEV